MQVWSLSLFLGVVVGYEGWEKKKCCTVESYIKIEQTETMTDKRDWEKRREKHVRGGGEESRKDLLLNENQVQ